MKIYLSRLFLILALVVPPWGMIGEKPAVLAADDGVTVTVDGNTLEPVGPGGNFYRGLGIFQITITTESDSQYLRKVASAQASCIGTPNPCGNQAVLDFLIDDAGIATAQGDMDAMSNQDWNLPYIQYQITGSVDVFDDQGDFHHKANFKYDLLLTKTRLIRLNDADDRFTYFSVFEAYWDNGIIKERPLAGEVVTPSSSSFKFEPSQNTTDLNGRAYFQIVPSSQALSQAQRAPLTGLQDDPYFSGQVTVNVSGEKSETVTHHMAYARVTALRGQVL